MDEPITAASDLDKLRPVDVLTDLGYVGEAVRQTTAALPKDVPLIGFAGAPFTLASYLIEGGSSAAIYEDEGVLAPRARCGQTSFRPPDPGHNRFAQSSN